MKQQSLFSLFGGAEEIDEAANMKDSEALAVASAAGVATGTGSEDSEEILPVPLAIAVPVPVVVVAAEIVAGATASVVATLDCQWCWRRWQEFEPNLN